MTGSPDTCSMMTEQAEHASPSPLLLPGASMDRRITKPARPWWRRRAVIVAVAGVIATLLIWWVLPASGSTDIALADIETGTVTRAPFADYLPVRATVAPRLTTLVGVLAGGQVERLFVQDGAMVTAGQTLATLANPSLKLDVLSREAQIAGQLGGLASEDLGIERNRLERDSQLAQATYDLLKARRELTKHQLLHDKGIIADAGLKGFSEEAAYQEKRLAQLQSGTAAEAQIAATQEARLADTRNRLGGNLAAVRAGLDALIVRAPVGGRLTNFAIQPGQTLKPGDPAGQVDSEGAWKLEADVDEFYLGRVSVGQQASADGARLTVSKVLPAVKDGKFRVELTFDGPAPVGLNRGQTMDSRITLGSTAPALVVPVGGWLERSNGTSIFVIDPDGSHARRRPVRVGRRNPQQVEILAGLAPQDRIVTSNTSSVRGDVLNLR